MTRRVVFVSPGMDTGGQSIALKRAFDACAPEWSARAIRRRDNWIHYPADVTWDPHSYKDVRTVKNLLTEADVIHIMQVPTAIRSLPAFRRKPIVVQHHGTYFRNDPKGVSAACRMVRASEVAIDHGLLVKAPRAELLPAVVDLDGMAALREEHYAPGEKVRIFHSPTDRSIKSTEALIGAVDRLSTAYPVELVLVEGKPWQECLRQKAARADIVFDQVRLGYGINAIEAWGMGVPVVAGIADPEARSLMVDEWGALPFIEATEDTIVDALEPLVADETIRAGYGAAGQRHAEQLHSQRAVVERAIAVYDRILGGVPA